MNPREKYFDTLYNMAEQGEDIVIVTPDLAAPSLDKFRRDFPEKYVSVGIAEQNLIQVSSGLAIEGKKVVAWGLNPFVITRGLDHIRNTVSLMKIPMTIAALHTGLASAISGPSHVVINDLSLVRTLEHIKCVNPADYKTAELVAKETVSGKRAIYARFDKDIIWEDIGYDKIDFDCGISCLHKGKDKIAVMVTGWHTKMVMDLLPRWNDAGIDPVVINIYTFPFKKDAMKEMLSGIEQIVTIEEHILQGGFSSAVLEAMADMGIVKNVTRIGIDMEQGYPEWFGRRTDMQKHFGLDEENIYKKVIEL